MQHKLSLMRAHDTSTSKFRGLLREISLLLGYEATRDLALEEIEIETPLERARVPVLAGKKLCLVSILRAGNGILDGMLDLVPSARVGHIGLYREPRTLHAVEYYLKLPEDLPERDVILVDPMLATGNSAVAAISRLVELRARSIKFVCLVAAPEGIAQVQRVIPTCRSSPPRSTAASTTTATSCPGSAMPATGCSARNSQRRLSAAAKQDLDPAVLRPALRVVGAVGVVVRRHRPGAAVKFLDEARRRFRRMRLQPAGHRPRPLFRQRQVVVVAAGRIGMGNDYDFAGLRGRDQCRRGFPGSGRPRRAAFCRWDRTTCPMALSGASRDRFSRACPPPWLTRARTAALTAAASMAATSRRARSRARGSAPVFARAAGLFPSPQTPGASAGAVSSRLRYSESVSGEG